MYRRYYDGYNNYEQDRRDAGQGEVVVPRAAEETVETAANVQEAPEIERQESGQQRDLQFTIENGESAVASCNRRGGLFDRFALDDIILIGVLILILQDGVDDTLLLVVLGFIFLVGFLD